MSSLNVPPFDLLTDQATPYSGFGEAHAVFTTGFESYSVTARRARDRIKEIFRVALDADRDSIETLERIIAQMWSEGWDATEGNVNLFATDFGCVLTDSLQKMYRGSLVLRSDTDLSHASLWWARRKVEAFPFHKTYKRLYVKDGESITFFTDRVASLVAHPEQSD